MIQSVPGLHHQALRLHQRNPNHSHNRPGVHFPMAMQAALGILLLSPDPDLEKLLRVQETICLSTISVPNEHQLISFVIQFPPFLFGYMYVRFGTKNPQMAIRWLFTMPELKRCVCNGRRRQTILQIICCAYRLAPVLLLQPCFRKHTPQHLHKIAIFPLSDAVLLWRIRCCLLVYYTTFSEILLQRVTQKLTTTVRTKFLRKVPELVLHQSAIFTNSSLRIRFLFQQINHRVSTKIVYQYYVETITTWCYFFHRTAQISMHKISYGIRFAVRHLRKGISTHLSFTAWTTYRPDVTWIYFQPVSQIITNYFVNCLQIPMSKSPMP
ncbi:uncharacterized protein LOC128737070 [Sabethes cyaneus]|uniref:uncharacterized protein LOC128737070 n=1 Tax=Sabethes cyaneus TaxID=53552 RepID=UPI00237DFB86|nr:uncharacterized protein LOC128737070 [Sabethes cyaneus]XP_053687598.1 uncharacterized protein LOC128737070 [Sabethes cyaneus]